MPKNTESREGVAASSKSVPVSKNVDKSIKSPTKEEALAYVNAERIKRKAALKSAKLNSNQVTPAGKQLQSTTSTPPPTPPPLRLGLTVFRSYNEICWMTLCNVGSLYGNMIGELMKC
jgi:hypothetical protein